MEAPNKIYVYSESRHNMVVERLYFEDLKDAIFHMGVRVTMQRDVYPTTFYNKTDTTIVQSDSITVYRFEAEEPEDGFKDSQVVEFNVARASIVPA